MDWVRIVFRRDSSRFCACHVCPGPSRTTSLVECLVTGIEARLVVFLLDIWPVPPEERMLSLKSSRHDDETSSTSLGHGEVKDSQNYQGRGDEAFAPEHLD